MANVADRPDGSPGRGRSTKISPELQKQIVEVLEEGNYREVAADCVGVPATTISKWMRKGKLYPNGVYGTFRQAVLKAEREAERRCVRALIAAGSEDWKANAWYLERKFRDRWGKTEKVELTGAKGGPVQHEVELTPSEAVKTIEEANRAAARWAAKTTAVAEAATSAAVEAIVAETSTDPEADADGGDHP